MTRKLFSILVCVSMLFASLACQLFSGPNLPKAPTAAVINSIEATPTEDTAASAAEATQVAEESALATEEAQSASATEEAVAQVNAQATDQANQRLLRTATAVGQSTAQANDMYQLIEKLQQDGDITSNAGQYYKIDDFSGNWAQLNFYQGWATGHKASDFVLRAHTAWESASKTANWYEAGCGFRFREMDGNNHYMIFLALDSNVYLIGYVDGNLRQFGRGAAPKINHLKGEADIVLIAQGDHFIYYVNGQKVFDRNNSALSGEGDLNFSIVSGTNKGFGTKCDITNVELWKLNGQ
jgi:hypothetical protein